MEGKEGVKLPWSNAVVPKIAKDVADASFALCNSLQSSLYNIITKNCVRAALPLWNGALAVLVIHSQHRMLFSSGQPSLNYPIICTVSTPISTSLTTSEGLRKLDSAPPLEIKPGNLIMTIGVLGEEIVPTAYQSQRRNVYVVRLLTQRIANHLMGTATTRTAITTLCSAAVELQLPSFLIKSTTSCNPTTSDRV